MSDTIGGIAILDETTVPPRLHFVCIRQNGDRKPWKDSIPLRPIDTPADPTGMTWEYRDDGGILFCRPSVRMNETIGYNEDKTPIMREFFHNAGQWSVGFQRWKPREGFVSDGSGVDWEGIHARLKELNPSFLSPESVNPETSS